MSDVYSMSMTIYEVSSLQYKSGEGVEVVPGFDGHAPVS